MCGWLEDGGMATKRKRQTKERPVAMVTIHGPGKMTKRGRRDIATWLRNHAAWLLKRGDEYTDGRFTGRFLYR
jgi:hypothetical protein